MKNIDLIKNIYIYLQQIIFTSLDPDTLMSLCLRTIQTRQPLWMVWILLASLATAAQEWLMDSDWS